MSKRNIVVFSLIFVYLCSVGSTYAFMEKEDVTREHSPQRTIEREKKQIPDESSLNEHDENQVDAVIE